MDIKTKIQKSWNIHNEFIKLSLNKEIVNKVKDKTSFLDKKYNKISFRLRCYCIINDIETVPLCANCNIKHCAIDNTYPKNGFRTFCSLQCSRSYEKIDKDVLSLISNYKWLHDQRVIKKKSIENIAEDLGISTTPIVKYLKRFNLHSEYDRRRNSVSIQILNNKNKLLELYSAGLTCEQIGHQFEVSKSTISHWLNVYNIETRNSNEYKRKIVKTSKAEKEIFEFIQQNYKGDIQQSNRSILKGQELDIYLPEFKFAIEHNGLYYHYYRPEENTSASKKDSSYHLNKTLQCLNKDIVLFQFYSDEWINKKDIVKSMICNKLNINNKIYARKCKIQEISTHEKNIFLDNNHLQGKDKSKVKLGLFYENELVSVMTFTKSRFNAKYEWELSRFSSKLNHSIVGGFSKMLKYFRSYNSGSIISYADRRYSNGELYRKNNFNLIGINSPSYYYVDSNFNQRFHRMNFQKKYINATSQTEYERMRELGYQKIYDCGTLAFGLQ